MEQGRGGTQRQAGQELPSLEMRTVLETVVLLLRAVRGRALQGFQGPEAASVHHLQPRGRAMLSPLQVTQFCLTGDDATATAVKKDAISS